MYDCMKVVCHKYLVGHFYYDSFAILPKVFCFFYISPVEQTPPVPAGRGRHGELRAGISFQAHMMTNGSFEVWLV